MKIAVIGATGSTGQNFVKQSLAKGHHVTVLVRSPQKLTIEDPNLNVIIGDVLNVDDVAHAVSGQDAIFIALGTGKVPKKSSIRADGTQQVVKALGTASEKPYIVILSSLGVGDSKKQYPFYWNWILNLFLRYAFADHQQQEKIIQDSSLPYAILRPTFMNHKPVTGHAKATAAPETVNILASLPRADVANYALNAIEKQNHHRQEVALTA